MITADFGNSAKQVSAGLRTKYPAVLQAVELKMNQLMLLLQRYIVGEKLQGQVLNHITGKLAASVRTEPSTTSGDVVTGGVQAGGGVAYYAKFQNDGTSSPYEIRPKNAKALAFFPAGGVTPINKQVIRHILGGSGLKSKKGSVRISAAAKFGNLGGVVVKSVMHPPIKQRNFMESSLQEMQEEIQQGLSSATVTGMRKK